MPTQISRSVSRRPPLHALLVPVPIVCFVGTLVTDVAYWQTTSMQWANMSAWLLTVGLIFSLVAALAGIVDFWKGRRLLRSPSAWIHPLGNGIVLILSIVNAFIHSRDAYTSVVPTGLTLSAIVVLMLIVTVWQGWGLAYRRNSGLRDGARS